MKKDIIDYFNSINGKALSVNKLEDDLQKLKGFDNENFIKDLKSNHPEKEGASKGFYKLKKPKFAILKSKDPVDECNVGIFSNVTSNIIEFNKMLLACGANVAKLYSIFYADKTYVEI